ncbi:MAG: hypothetical protein V4477_16825 [Pseudomonadota bacterium]
MSSFVAALDSALAGYGEDIILRRVVGTAPNQANIDVTCRARVDAMKAEEIVAGLPATDLNIIISPTQINNAQWPGGQVPLLPPFNVDQRVPRINGPDKVLLRGGAPRTVAFCDPKFINGELVRINMRVTGTG